MQWRGQGILLSVRRHGETSAIIEVFTPEQGRHAGVVRGGTSRKIAPILQPGAQLDVAWWARLDNHIGTFTVEPLHSRAAQVMNDRLALAGMLSVLALLRFALPERAPQPGLYARSLALLDMLGQSDLWPLAYLRWEQALLDDMGFGLDLGACAVTGATTDLAYVSPKSGRAVSRAGAGEWASRLLPLPACLLGQGVGDLDDVMQGLQVTGHFLLHHLAPGLGASALPDARLRFVDALARRRA
jgi:DNA repair protein RecO (recombination protein O)